MISTKRPSRGGSTRILLLAMVLLLGVSGLVIGPASPALAACRGGGCHGQNPNGQCTATGTPQERFFGNYTLQLKYSAGCYAFWGRAKQGNCSASPPAYVRVQRRVDTPVGYRIVNTYYSGQLPCNGNFAWTPMAGENPPDQVRSCLAAAYDTRPPFAWPDSWWTCVDWTY